MIESIESPEDIDKLLSAARTTLESFEDNVDRKRLLKRLKTASPSHPVLLFRGLFMLLTVLMMSAAMAILITTIASPNLARTIAKFDQIVPMPPEVPALPALFGGLALLMSVGWIMTTLAALAMGRDAQMLPWEQKAHQKMVNEVTRLTTQKAVTARMRNTPVGARPRLQTPVPVSLRDRAGIATPAGVGRSGSSALGSRNTPNPAPSLGDAQPGRFGPAGGAQGNNPFRASPKNKLGASSNASNPFGPPPGATPMPLFSTGGYSAPSGAGGMRAHGPAESVPTGRGVATPAGAAGRIDVGKMTPSNGRVSPFDAAPSNTPSAAVSTGNPFGRSAQVNDAATNSPLGAPPAAASASSIFGRPADPGHPKSSGGSLLARARAGGGASQPADESPQIVDSAPAYSSTSPAGGPARTLPLAGPTTPRWGRIEDPWLEAALSKAEALADKFPVQAHLEYSQEAHLPFTLVIARATPAIAVSAMNSYVEFLASIETPPRARIELKSAANLDRGFHRNVETTLEPYFGEHLEVEAEPGRVEIIFHRPDPSWQDFPILPME
ncbi:MAG: hypothetical protein GWP91_25770 [Rhodobacterales bacterium]|nr:hypothetical protein [Rhodobacterales bacterium]